MSAFPRDFPRRGEIYWVDFGATKGSEQAGRRPAVVVSNDVSNQHSPVVVVAAITSKVMEKRYPHQVYLPSGALAKEGTILCNQLRTIARERLSRYQGDLDAQRTAELNDALAISLGLPRLRSAPNA